VPDPNADLNREKDSSFGQNRGLLFAPDKVILRELNQPSGKLTEVLQSEFPCTLTCRLCNR
jgi:hypothetical protein